MENKAKLKIMIVTQNVKLHKHHNGKRWIYSYFDQLK